MSPEWTILSHVSCFIQGEVVRFQVCWIVFIPIVWGRPDGLLQFSVGEAVKIFVASVSSSIRALRPNTLKCRACTIAEIWLLGCPSHLIIPHTLVLHRVRKKTAPPKHVQITLWIENDSRYFSLYHEKLSICNVYVKFHDNQFVHCRDIAFYKKMVENCRRQHCQ